VLDELGSPSACTTRDFYSGLLTVLSFVDIYAATSRLLPVCLSVRLSILLCVCPVRAPNSKIEKQTKFVETFLTAAEIVMPVLQLRRLVGRPHFMSALVFIIAVVVVVVSVVEG